MNRSGIAGVVIIAVSIAVAAGQAPKPDPSKFLTQPLVKDLYTADPSAHVFNGKLFIYPSHDIDAGVPADDLGSHFAMRDYHVFSMDAVGGKVTDHGVALDIRNVPWAGRQMWAPDAAEKGGKYYLYFPVKDKQDVFRIGAAVGNSPAGPFTAQAEPIKGSYSIDPAVFKDTDGKYYMYFGGIWGGQLQRWASGTYTPKDTYPAKDQPALSAKIARLGDDMVSLRGSAQRRRPARREAARRSPPVTTAAASSKPPGCTSATARTTSRTRPATRTSSCMRPGRRRTVRSPSRARSSSRCSAGRITTRSSSSRESRTSSITTRSSRAARRTCATSR